MTKLSHSPKRHFQQATSRAAATQASPSPLICVAEVVSGATSRALTVVARVMRADVDLPTVQRLFSQMWEEPACCCHVLKLPLVLNIDPVHQGDLKPLCEAQVHVVVQDGGETAPITGFERARTPQPRLPEAPKDVATWPTCTYNVDVQSHASHRDLEGDHANLCGGEVQHHASVMEQSLASAITTLSTATSPANLDALAEADLYSGEVRRLAWETDQRLARAVPFSWDLSHDDGHRYVMPLLLHTSYGAGVLHVVRKSMQKRRVARRWEPVAKKRGP